MATTIARVNTDTSTRVQDYLNDQFQSISDLENIDSLLAKIQEQQTLLKEQLVKAKEDHRHAERVFEEEKTSLSDRASRQQADQTDLTRRIQIITQSEVSDDAIRKLDEPLQKLRRIEIAEQYVTTLQHAGRLEDQARSSLPSNPERAIQAYQSLQRLVYDVEDAQSAAEGAASQLVLHLSNIAEALYQSIKHDLENALRKTLDKMKWPAKEVALLQPLVEDWSKQAKLLLQLQEPRLLRAHADSSRQNLQEPIVLLPLSVMVSPLAQRFRYHFYGDKPTNKLDKPEYFFAHVLGLLDQHNGLVTDLLQPVLDSRVQHDDSLDLVYTDAVSSYISALLPMLSAKCLSVLPHLTSQPQLMSHFVRETMSFDTTLQQFWAYNPYPGPLSEWKGLAWDMLTTHGYFDSWLNLEKNFALLRYDKIIDNPDSRSIDYDGVEQGRTKPTKGAIRINDLLEKITERYRMISSFSQKMKFLMDIQLAVFDRYHQYLHEHFRTYQTQSHTAGRLATGSVTAGEALGLPGLESLAKIFGSAEYLERKMTDWSDDVFFLELWEELQDRASQHQGINGTVGRDLSVEEVASKTSSTIRNTDDILENHTGALFDETASAYRRVREQSESEIVRLLQINAHNSLKSFQAISIWTSLSMTTFDLMQLSPSSVLDSFNQTMIPLLDFVAKVLAPTALRRVAKQLCHSIQEEILDRLVLRNSFSAAGANQLRRDMLAISSTIDSNIRLRDEAQRHFVKLNDALVLLSLPITGSGSQVSDTDGDGWDFEVDENEADADANNEAPLKGGAWGLWQAERAIFADNASARKALQSMGLIDLSESEARNIIKRRIEVNS
ncbi:hypothetical protein LTR51_008511 [Lithohypha guttulata]|nr:hypothetical protein LTR51_008511 [Lithohypha guttulata]